MWAFFGGMCSYARFVMYDDVGEVKRRYRNWEYCSC